MASLTSNSGTNQKVLLAHRVNRLKARITRLEFRLARGESKENDKIFSDNLEMCKAELSYKGKKLALL